MSRSGIDQDIRVKRRVRYEFTCTWIDGYNVKQGRAATWGVMIHTCVRTNCPIVVMEGS